MAEKKPTKKKAEETVAETPEAVEETPVAEEAPVVDHGSVALRAAPVLRRVLGWVLFALSALLLAVLAWYVLTALGVIG